MFYRRSHKEKGLSIIITTTDAAGIIPQLVGMVIFLSIGGGTVWGLNTWQKSTARAELDKLLLTFGLPITVAEIEAFALAAVRGVEQLFGKAVPGGATSNPDKKAWAINVLQGFLAGSEVGAGGKREFDAKALATLVESALARLKIEELALVPYRERGVSETATAVIANGRRMEAVANERHEY